MTARGVPKGAGAVSRPKAIQRSDNDGNAAIVHAPVHPYPHNQEVAVHRAIPGAAIISFIMFCGPAALGQTEGSRYTMAPTDGGFVRLDTVTGAMSLCSQESGEWSCKPMQTDEQASESELEKLKAANAELQSELRRLENEKKSGKPDGGSGGPLSGPPRDVPELELPSEEQVDQAIDYLESMIRKFRERFEDFGEKTRPGRGPGPHSNPESGTTPNGSPTPGPAPSPESAPNGGPNGPPNGEPKTIPNSNPSRGPETQL